MAPRQARSTKSRPRRSRRLASLDPDETHSVSSSTAVVMTIEPERAATPPTPFEPFEESTMVIDYAGLAREPVMEDAPELAVAPHQHPAKERTEEEEVQDFEEREDDVAVPEAILELVISQAETSIDVRPAETPAPRWRLLASSIGGYLGPFKRRTPQPSQAAAQSVERKRAGLDEQELVPSARRVRTEGSMSPPQSNERHPRILSERHQQPVSSLRFTSPSPANNHWLASTTARAQRTPLHHSSLSSFTSATLSTTKPDMPAPLNTITENVEQPTKLISERNTPSAPSLATPSRVPKRRSIKDVRAMHDAKRQTPNTGSYAWERSRSSATPKPPPPFLNADQRLEKLARYQALQRDIEARTKEKAELEKDKDIEEMRSHKRRRVHVDGLLAIPHKRPEDPVGTFRVPEWDSDDEMEVDENVEERRNVFEQAQEAQQVQQKAQTQPVPPRVQLPAKPMEQPVQMHQKQQTPVAQKPPPRKEMQLTKPPDTQVATATPTKWSFPSLGKRRPAHALSAGEELRSKMKFATGFDAWRKQTSILV